MNKALKLACFVLLVACTAPEPSRRVEIDNKEFLFEKMNAQITGVDFSNEITENTYFNFINYSYVYNGGGVSVADFNNDDLLDLYFTANQTSNKLYLNQGDFRFQDITDDAGVQDDTGWTTGTTVMDINNDGLLDIYVCKSGSLRDPKTRENILYINQGNLQFTNEAEKWGLNNNGFSIQAYFLDYDRDGDLDMYLVNHRPDFENNVIIKSDFQVQENSPFTDRLYRNNGTKYEDVTEESGLLNNAWGLSAAIGDFNNDHWPDIYVCNDFLEPDFLYINDRHGGFDEQVGEIMGHISMNSMGSDLSDINNDGNLDLYVAEMSPSDHVRSKQNMASMSTKNFENMVASNYHYQYMNNVLQLSTGNGRYSEVAQLGGIAKTDWSWSPLIADFDNDGYKDIFVTNGIVKDLSNTDFRNQFKSKVARREKMSLDQALSMIPSQPLLNPIYKNNGDLTFTPSNKEWNIQATSFSNGAAYADLDNDGDLDLVVNNTNEPAHLYRNNSAFNSLRVKLKGSQLNPIGLGARVTIYLGESMQVNEMYLSRGYQSSIPNILHFGIGEADIVDSMKIVWPDGKAELLTGIKANEIVIIAYRNAAEQNAGMPDQNTWLHPLDNQRSGLLFEHRENTFDDFKNQLLLPYKLSQSGPFMVKGDINGDGLEDLFIGGAFGQAGKLYVQLDSGKFEEKAGPWSDDKIYEDTGGLFLDIDSDGDLDLLVISGGGEHEQGHELLEDRVYINDAGTFKRAEVLPEIRENGKVAISGDIDKDGDLDLFIGGRLLAGKYPSSPPSYFLINEGGIFHDRTAAVAPDFSSPGMITGATFTDYDQDGDDDLLIVGEWTAIQLWENNDGVFTYLPLPELEHTRGLWFSLDKFDIDHDGDDDYLLGNLGLNSKYKSGKGKEFHIYAADFDASGTMDIALSNKYNGKLVPVRGRECSSQQTPFIKNKFPDYNSFARATMSDIFGEDKLSKAIHHQADMLESIVLLNHQQKGFEIVKLPNQAQVAPILDFEFADINADGKLEILAVGNLYETEVETMRMDGARGHVLTWSKDSMHVLDHNQTGFFAESNAKSIVAIRNTRGGHYVIIGNNDSRPYLFETKTTNDLRYEK